MSIQSLIGLGLGLSIFLGVMAVGMRVAPADLAYFFTSGTAWGVATIAGDDVTLDVRGGRLDLASVSLRGRPAKTPQLATR